MPIYEYRCTTCSASFEALHGVRDKPLNACRCGGRGERIVSAPSIRFKGTGWYVNDYAKKARRREATS